MVTIAIAVMIIAAVAIVVHPYVVADGHEESLAKAADATWEDLVAQRDATYSAIKDLEFDHVMGKLSEEDYKLMRARYESKAVAILQQLDGLGAIETRRPDTLDRDAMIEEEVRRLRSGAGPVGPAGACPQCGTPHDTGDAFCARCGASLRGARCPGCGTRARVGDKFCARCGARIGELAGQRDQGNTQGT